MLNSCYYESSTGLHQGRWTPRWVLALQDPLWALGQAAVPLDPEASHQALPWVEAREASATVGDVW